MGMQKESSTNRMNILNAILVVKQSNLRNDNVIAFKKLPSQQSLNLIILKIKGRINRLINKKKKELFDDKYGFFNTDESKQYYTAEEILKVVPFKPDVIILHWISNFINSKTINELAETTRAKIFWIMMDNAPFTGGCHYPWDCIGFHSDCSECPAILDASNSNIAQKNLALKKEFLPDHIEVIACSQSDYMRAQKSSLFNGKKIHKLLFPIDENKFLPGDKKEAKSFFGIAEKVKVIFCGSVTLGRERKGGQFLSDSLIKLQNKLLNEKNNLDDTLILAVGKHKNNIYKNIKIPIMQVDYLNEESLIKAYQAADVFVSSSIEDSGPLMVNQSIMCGTPVVAFGTGVALDLVHKNETGYKAKSRNTEDLATGIEKILSLRESEYIKMSNNCRKIGLENFSSSIFTNKIMKISNENRI
jgi:glycosyltransferase involved in cell wall biosynthesis